MKEKMRKILTMFLTLVITCSVFVANTDSVNAATYNKIKYSLNVSYSQCKKNSTEGSMPTAISTAYTGDTIYFNLQANAKNTRLYKAVLYVKAPGDSKYTKKATEAASKTYFTYTGKKYTVGSKTGTLYYYWKITYYCPYSDSKKLKSTTKTVTSSTNKIKIKKWDPDAKLTAFLADSRWKPGTTWSASQKPKLSTYSCKGCMAYVADLAKYVYRSDSPKNDNDFTDVSKIKAGDILYLSNTKTGNPHWIYVISRSGNKLTTVEANWEPTVYKSSSKYTISGSKIKRGSTTFKLNNGYHFK